MAVRRNLFLLASLASGALALVLLAGFVWPDGSWTTQDTLNLGAAEDYERGSVTMHANAVDFTQERWALMPALTLALGRSVADRPVVIALARYEDGSFGALLARDTNSGCTLPWRPHFEFEGRVGWFRDPCHGSTYDAHGERVFGPSPRNMDYFHVEVNEAGDVIVDLRTLHEGDDPR